MSPEDDLSLLKVAETVSADSTAWFVTVTAPTDTVSTNTSPLDALPSPYLILHVAPDSGCEVVLLEGLYSI